jgi:prepilin-type N-terminal cleavage/methylation domain-containing protein
MTNERGFTLVEALIALTISGIIGSALISLLTAQSRFYSRTDDQRVAEQTAQATFDLFSSEVRLAGASDLLAAEADSVTLRIDLLRGILCDVSLLGAASLYIYDRNTTANLTSSFVGVAASSPYEEDFAYADSWNPTPTATGAVPKALCVLTGTPSTGALTDYLLISGWNGKFAAPERQEGTLVRVYGKLTYKIAASNFFTTRSALWRGTQELIGPFENGAALSYVMDDGSVQTNVASASFDDVSAIRVTATTVGEGSNRYNVSRAVNFDVPFRN